VKALKRSGTGWQRPEVALVDAMLELLPGTPGLQGEDGSVIMALGLPGGERVAGGDKAPAGTPTGLQWSSGFMCQVRGTASITREQILGILFVPMHGRKMCVQYIIFKISITQYHFISNKLFSRYVLKIQ